MSFRHLTDHPLTVCHPSLIHGVTDFFITEKAMERTTEPELFGKVFQVKNYDCSSPKNWMAQ